MAVRKKPGAKRRSTSATKKTGKAAPSKAGREAAGKKRPTKAADPKGTGAAKAAGGKKAAAKKTVAANAMAANKRPEVKKQSGRKTETKSSGKSSAKRPAAALAQSKAPPRKPARTAARRVAPVRVSEPRSAGVRKVGVRTAIQHETSRARRPERSRKPGKPALADLVRLNAPAIDRQEAVLTREALEFLALLHRQFDGRRLTLLARRHERQARFDAGERPRFLHETRHVRSSGWRVTGRPAELPAPRADVAVLDFEEAAPSVWRHVIAGHLAVLDHWSAAPEGGQPPAALAIRPRGWHLPEAHVTLDRDALSASLFDVGLTLMHTARRQMALGGAPRLCLPQIESYLEARLWSDVLIFAERHLGLPRGTCKVTVRIDTLPAAFEMEEIAFELREHIAGLAFEPAGLIASLIRRLGSHPDFLLPDRAEIKADRGFLAAIADRLASTCRRRGIALLGDLAHHQGPAHQTGGILPEDPATAEAMLAPPTGPRTRQGLRESLALALRHLADSLEGSPAGGPSHVAEAEIARALVWQWVRQGARLVEGEAVTPDRLRALIDDEIAALSPHPSIKTATQLYFEIVTAADCGEYLTLLTYRQLLERGL